MQVNAESANVSQPRFCECRSHYNVAAAAVKSISLKPPCNRVCHTEFARRRCIDPSTCRHYPARVQRLNAELRGAVVDEIRYKVMRLLEANPCLSQRELARELGISLGKVNYCLRALMRRGWIKATNFKNSHNKAAYMYLLTQRGVEQKANLTVQFLKRKMVEYETLRIEIEQMRLEAEASGVAGDDADDNR